MEIEDTYLRLDKDLGDFLIFLDKEVGKGQYTVFLTADHAVAHTPGYLQQHHMPFKTIAGTSGGLAKSIEEQFKIKQANKANANYQIYFNDSAIAAGGSGKETIKKFSIDYLNRQRTSCLHLVH
jgi:hypothetical protein